MNDFRSTEFAMNWLNEYKALQHAIEKWNDAEDQETEKGNHAKASRCRKRAEEAEAKATGMLTALECMGWTVEYRNYNVGAGYVFIAISDNRI